MRTFDASQSTADCSDAAAARRFFRERLAFTTGPMELNARLQRGEHVTVVDVRSADDYRAGHIPGAIHLPQGKWHTLAGIRKDRPVVVYCYNPTCKLATAAALEFASHGIGAQEMEGGFAAWRDYALPIAT
jgi:rhodanese-related sulfurtransferase